MLSIEDLTIEEHFALINCLFYDQARLADDIDRLRAFERPMDRTKAAIVEYEKQLELTRRYNTQASALDKLNRSFLSRHSNAAIRSASQYAMINTVDHLVNITKNS